MTENKSTKLREQLIEAGEKAVEELIKIAKEKILGKITDYDDDDDGSLAADKMKSAAGAKKVAIFDAFEILERIEKERINLLELEKLNGEAKSTGGFAEGRAKTISRSS